MPTTTDAPDALSGTGAITTPRPVDGLTSMISYLTRVLKTPTISRCWEDLAGQAREENWSHEEYLAAVLQRQVAERESAGTTMRIRTAHFPQVKTLEEFNLDHLPSLRRDVLAHLATGTFVARAENVILLGPPGLGKTHLAIGLGVRAAHAGYSVLFDTANNWIIRLAAAHQAGQLEAELKKIRRYKLIIIDEVGYIPFDTDAANLFFQLIASRYEQASVMVTSNLPFGRWGETFCDRRPRIDRPPGSPLRGRVSGRRVSGGLSRLPGVGVRPVEEVEHFVQDLDDGDLVEERGSVGAAVAGAVREAGGAGVGAADRAVHGPAQQRPVPGPDGRRGVDRVAAPVQPDGGGSHGAGQVQRPGVVGHHDGAAPERGSQRAEVRAAGQVVQRSRGVTAHGGAGGHVGPGADEHRAHADYGEVVGDGGEPLGGPTPSGITRPGVQRHPGAVTGQYLRGGGLLPLRDRQVGVLRRALRSDQRHHLEEPEHLALVVAVGHGGVERCGVLRPQPDRPARAEGTHQRVRRRPSAV